MKLPDIRRFLRPIVTPLTVAGVLDKIKGNLEDLSTIVETNRSMAKLEAQVAQDALQRASNNNRVAEEALRIRSSILNSL